MAKELGTARSVRARIGLDRKQMRGMHFSRGHRLELFDNGSGALAAMLEAIQGAEHHVHLESYIFRTDATGCRFLDRLAERAAAGTEVRLLLDAVGSRTADPAALRMLSEAGGQISFFNPATRWLRTFEPRRRDHRKILVVDDRIAFAGGANVGDEYGAVRDGRPTWRDAHARIEGPGVAELQALFLESWVRAGGERVDRRGLFARESPNRGDVSLAIVADGPTHRRRRMRDLLVSALEGARSEVLLVSPYFAPGHRVLEALGDASERGVRVELLIAGRTDQPLFRRAAREILPRLLRRGVRVFEDPHRMMHAKLAAFDDSLSVVGTSNLDRQSLEHSQEVNLVIEGPAVPSWIRARFGTDVSEVSPIDLDTLARRSLWSKGLDRLARLGVRLL